MIMLRRFLFFVTFAALGATASAGEARFDPEDNPLLRPPEPEVPPEPDVTKEDILEAYGYVLGRDFSDRLQLFPMFFSFGFTDEDFDIVMRGIAAAFKGQSEPVDLGAVGPYLKEFLDTRPEEVRQVRLAANRAEQEEALATVDAREEIQKTESGLRYEIRAPGSGEKPADDSIVVAHYRGAFVDGSEFESSLAFGQPARFSLDDVIPAWREGLQLIAPGGRVILFVPSELAYGDMGRAPIPPGKMLVFDLQLIAVEPPDSELEESSDAGAGAPADGGADATAQPTTP